MCPHCSHHLVQVVVRLDDARVTMHACSGCDRCWWDRDGQPVELGEVLALASAQA
jgi:Zn-finger nucleic acid-binding protein